MTHRTVNVSVVKVEVFDTRLGAAKWIKRHAGDCVVIVRGSSFFQRKNGVEMTVRLNASDNELNRHLVAAANNVADAVEAELAHEKAA